MRVSIRSAVAVLHVVLAAFPVVAVTFLALVGFALVVTPAAVFAFEVLTVETFVFAVLTIDLVALTGVILVFVGFVALTLGTLANGVLAVVDFESLPLALTALGRGVPRARRAKLRTRVTTRKDTRCKRMIDDWGGSKL